MAYVAETYPCILSRKHICGGRLTLHHDKECPGSPKNDRRVLPLCEAGHQHQAGLESVERLGKQKFQKRWGVDFEAIIQQQNEEYENEMANESQGGGAPSASGGPMSLFPPMHEVVPAGSLGTAEVLHDRPSQLEVLRSSLKGMKVLYILSGALFALAERSIMDGLPWWPDLLFGLVCFIGAERLHGAKQRRDSLGDRP